MDPQQRWLLETTWEALEDAGLPACESRGLRRRRLRRHLRLTTTATCRNAAASDVDAYTNTGSALSIAANRISYCFDLRGPSFAVDTACSSSLVALAPGLPGAVGVATCPLAIVGGVNSLLTPDLTIGFSKAVACCRRTAGAEPFDAAANGYVRAEGAGDGRAASRSTRRLPTATASTRSSAGRAVNQDGRTGGMTVPSRRAAGGAAARGLHGRAGVAPAQVELRRGARHRHAGRRSDRGDRDSARCLGRGGSRDEPLCDRVGQDPIIGHLEAASGVAGLIKLALALHHRAIPPSLHFRSPNPEIAFDALQLAVPTRIARLARAHDGRPALRRHQFVRLRRHQRACGTDVRAPIETTRPGKRDCAPVSVDGVCAGPRKRCAKP